jgi:hypothetical protein
MTTSRSKKLTLLFALWCGIDPLLNRRHLLLLLLLFLLAGGRLGVGRCDGLQGLFGELFGELGLFLGC